MKALLIRDIFSPVFFLDTDVDEAITDEKPIDISEDLYMRWRKVDKEFMAVQDELEKLWKANR